MLTEPKQWKTKKGTDVHVRRRMANSSVTMERMDEKIKDVKQFEWTSIRFRNWNHAEW